MAKHGTTRMAVYNYIYSRLTQGETSPTVREICAALNLKSTSTVHTHIEKLREDGYITFDSMLQRTIRLTDTIPQGSLAWLNGGSISRIANEVSVPLVGTVAAGMPKYAFEDIEARYVIPRELLHGTTSKDAFMLTVDGESMIDVGIYTGDKLILSKSMDIRDGDIVVARISGDSATVKRIFIEGDLIRLQPENSLMQPIIVNASDVEIIGRVIGLIRSY